PAFISAKSLRVGAEIWPFLTSHKLIVRYLTIDQPEIALVQTPAGDWNFSSLGGKPQARPAQPSPGSEPLDLSVQDVKITGARVTLKRTVGHWKPMVLEQLNLELKEFSATTAFPFTLTGNVVGGGSVKVSGKAGPINAADTSLTPVNLTLQMDRLDLAGSGMN